MIVVVGDCCRGDACVPTPNRVLTMNKGDHEGSFIMAPCWAPNVLTKILYVSDVYVVRHQRQFWGSVGRSGVATYQSPLPVGGGHHLQERTLILKLVNE